MTQAGHMQQLPLLRLSLLTERRARGFVCPAWLPYHSLHVSCRTASFFFFSWLRGLARLCTYISSILSVLSGALSFTVR